MEESEERKNKPSGKHLFPIQSNPVLILILFHSIQFDSLPFDPIRFPSIRSFGTRPMVLNRIADSAFKQQKLPAWQPILTAGTVLPTFALIGIAFIPIGFSLLMLSNKVCTFLWNVWMIRDYILYILYICIFYILHILYIVSHHRSENTRLITRAAKSQEGDQRHVQVWLKSRLDQVVLVFLSSIWPKSLIEMSLCTIRWPTTIRIIDAMSSLEMTNSCLDSKGIQVMIVCHSSTRKQTLLVGKWTEQL